MLYISCSVNVYYVSSIEIQKHIYCLICQHFKII